MLAPVAATVLPVVLRSTCRSAMATALESIDPHGRGAHQVRLVWWLRAARHPAPRHPNFVPRGAWRAEGADAHTSGNTVYHQLGSNPCLLRESAGANRHSSVPESSVLITISPPGGLWSRCTAFWIVLKALWPHLVRRVPRSLRTSSRANFQRRCVQHQKSGFEKGNLRSIISKISLENSQRRESK